jgi:hypothetical protein
MKIIITFELIKHYLFLISIIYFICELRLTDVHGTLWSTRFHVCTLLCLSLSSPRQKNNNRKWKSDGGRRPLAGRQRTCICSSIAALDMQGAPWPSAYTTLHLRWVKLKSVLLFPILWPRVRAGAAG